MLASHPGFVYDANQQPVVVEPAVQAQMGDVLAYISADYEANALPGQPYSLPEPTPSRESLVWGNDGDMNGVVITAVAEPGQVDLLVATMRSLGSTSVIAYNEVVNGVLPFAAIDDLSAVPSLDYADVVYEPVHNASSAWSALNVEGDIALLADVARTRFGVDGTGLRIGIISNSFNVKGGYAFDVSSGVLPAGIEVLKEGPPSGEGNADEGRAMAQLIHAIAPGATLLFASEGVGGPADIADSVEKLAAAGCQIIVDDVTEASVPWFSDGVVAQAVNAAVRDSGVAYFTSAGNFGRNSYESEFRGIAGDTLANLPTFISDVVDFPGMLLHDFDPGPGVDLFQRITIPSGTHAFEMELQWDQPWGANQSDVDIFIFAADGETLLSLDLANPQFDANPQAHVSINVDGIDTVQLVVAYAGGVVPTFLKYVTYKTKLQAEYASGASTIVGHANSATAAAIGAANYFATPPYGQSPAGLTDYSSWGGTPLLFDLDGNRLPTPEVRNQPRFVGPSNSNTSFFGDDVNFDGLPNFSGTSAAAPQAAAVAALMLQLVPTLSPADVFEILGATASDMLGPGFDFGTGVGMLHAERALARTAAISFSGTVFEDFDRNGLQTADELPISDATVFLDLNGNGRLDVSPAPGSATAYASFASTEPVHVGIRSEIPNPNTPNNGPLLRPFTATSPVDVADLPGVVTDVGVIFTLQSDSVINGYGIGPLFITLISPEGIRVPLRGTTVVVTELDHRYNAEPFMIAASGERKPYLNSLSPTPASDFATGSGFSHLPQVDLAAVVGTAPNGTWQLEVQNADFDPQKTLSLDSWTLYLKSAEPTVQTDAAGDYTFAGLPPSAVAGVFSPRLVLPASRSLTTEDDYALTLAVGQAIRDVDFGVTIPQPLPRPALLPVSVLRVSGGAIGPQPIVFSWSDLSAAALTQPTGDRFVVVAAVRGRVEKWDGEAWIDVNRLPASGSPQEMLNDLARRVIRPNDTIRWVPPSNSSADEIAFTILGWNGFDTSDGTSDVSFAAPPA